MTAKRVETLTWVLIYGGMIAFAIGWFLMPTRGPWGELLLGGGTVAAVVGVAMIFMRARMKE